jgi:type I restriction enzyme S subunit
MATDCWSTKKLSEICLKITDGTHKSPPIASSGQLYVTSKNIRPFRLDLSDPTYISDDHHREIYSRCDVRRGDVLLTKDGANTGNACINPLEGPFSLLSSVAMLRPHPEHLTSEFLVQVLNSSSGRALTASRMDGLAIRRLTLATIGSLAVPIPPIPEQRKIAAILSSVDETIEKTEGVIAQLEVVKKAMLEELLTRGMPGRHTRFKETEIGKVPEGWEVATLGDRLAGIDAGWSPLCEAQPATGEEWGVLKVSSVTWGEFRPEENKRLPSGLDPRPEATVAHGDVLISRANTPELVGRAVVVRESWPRLMMSDKLLRLRPKSDRADGRFVCHSLSSTRAREYLKESATGSSRSMRNLSQDKIRALPIAWPGVEEQCMIGDALDAVASALLSEKRIGEALASCKRALSSALLAGEIRVAPKSA